MRLPDQALAPKRPGRNDLTKVHILTSTYLPFIVSRCLRGLHNTSMIALPLILPLRKNKRYDVDFDVHLNKQKKA